MPLYSLEWRCAVVSLCAFLDVVDVRDMFVWSCKSIVLMTACTFLCLYTFDLLTFVAHVYYCPYQHKANLSTLMNAFY